MGGTSSRTTLNNLSTESYLSYFAETTLGGNTPDKGEVVYQSTLLGQCNQNSQTCSIVLKDAATALHLGDTPDPNKLNIQTSSSPSTTISGALNPIHLFNGAYDPADPKTYLLQIDLSKNKNDESALNINVKNDKGEDYAKLNIYGDSAQKLKKYGNKSAKVFQINANLEKPASADGSTKAESLQFCQFQLPYLDPLTGLDYSYNDGKIVPFLDPAQVQFIQYKREGQCKADDVIHTGAECQNAYSQFKYSVEACAAADCKDPTVLFEVTKDFAACVDGKNTDVGTFVFEPNAKTNFVADGKVTALNGCILSIQPQGTTA